MVPSLLLLGLAAEAPVLELRAAIHVHTTFSDGKHSVEEIAEKARNAGVDVVVLGDHFMDEITYGLPLLREAFSVTLGVPSLTPERMSSFLDATREAEKRTGVLILPGVELTPYYYWQGSLLRGDLTLRSGDRHLLVVFPDRPDPQALVRALPTVASPAGRRLGIGSVLLLWPLIALAWGLHRLAFPRLRVIRARYFVVRRLHRGRLAWVVVGLSIVVLGRSWPFTVPRFSPYANVTNNDDGVGLAPYQYAADEAAKAGTLTFWPHPEASVEYRHPRYPVTYRSNAYSEFVARTTGITGFASLYEGYRRAAAPGGPWDEALLAFCAARRNRPVWTMGEISLHEEGEAGGKKIGQVETVLRARDRSRAAVVEALARGFGYAVRHAPGSRLFLEDFAVASGGRAAQSGERLESHGGLQVEVRLRREGQSSSPVTIRVIRDGAVVQSGSMDVTDRSTSFVWMDSSPIVGVSYYRIAIEGRYPEMILSNPVFVLRREHES